MPYLTTRKKPKATTKPCPGLVASYDIQPGNGVGLFWDTIHTPDPHGELQECVVTFMSWSSDWKLQMNQNSKECRSLFNTVISQLASTCNQQRQLVSIRCILWNYVFHNSEESTTKFTLQQRFSL